jgi:hypothetical protein
MEKHPVLGVFLSFFSAKFQTFFGDTNLKLKMMKNNNL